MILTKEENILCTLHPNNQISHICTLKNCHKSLCINCIPQHLKNHGIKKECAILEEFCFIKKKCINILDSLNELFLKTNANIEKIISNSTINQNEDHWILIDHLKVVFIKMIDLHFEKIKKDFDEIKQKQLLKIKDKKKEFQNLFTEIEKILIKIKENKNICEQIQEFFISNIQEKFLNSLKNIEDYIKLKKSQNIIKVDELRINEIKELFKKCLFIQENTLEDTNSFKIQRVDYFEKNCKRNYLHYFEERTKNIHLLNIEDYWNHIKNFSIVEMDIGFEIPDYHRSISLPNGDIFLIGGEMTLLEDKPTINMVWSYDFLQKTLIPKSSMINERNSFGIVFLDDFIYVFGGFDKNDNSSLKCEKYSLFLDEWLLISDMKTGLINCCVSKFNNDSIYLFGGLKENNQINNEIMKYHIENDKWSEISFAYEDETQQQMKFSHRILFPYLAGCCQINEEEIFIFGGKDYNLNYASQNLICEIKETINVKIISRKKLKFPGSFISHPILSNNQVLCLQNICDEINKFSISNNKRIARFDDKKCIFD